MIDVTPFLALKIKESISFVCPDTLIELLILYLKFG